MVSNDTFALEDSVTVHMPDAKPLLAPLPKPKITNELENLSNFK